MSNFLTIAEIVLAIVMSALILLQVKGTGLGSTFGGEMGFYSTKRGFEKMLFYFTIIIATLFLTIAALRLLV